MLGGGTRQDLPLRGVPAGQVLLQGMPAQLLGRPQARLQAILQSALSGALTGHMPGCAELLKFCHESDSNVMVLLPERHSIELSGGVFVLKLRLPLVYFWGFP